jgi:Na+-translocating ferredoxin:NAD+ oxidoreductase RnfD subunit
MITQPKIIILSLVCAVFVGKNFYSIYGKDFLHPKVLEADLN